MKKERVELNVHTKMSAMDAVTSISEYIKRAAKWGHTAIAITDHGCVQAFPEARRVAEELKKQGSSVKIIYGMEAYCADKEDAQPFHMTILVQNQTGLKNLYHLVSLSHLHRFQGVQIITKEELKKHRDGLLLGSGCGNGKLFCAAAQGKAPEELYAIAREYDFLEIQPVWNCKYANAVNGKIQEELQRINTVIVRIGEEIQMPVCATGNVHYLEPEDAQAYHVLKSIYGASENKIQDFLHFRSTKEMLNAFNYLGEEKTYEVVIDNTNKIADSIEKVCPIPEGRFFPFIDDAEERLTVIARSRAETLYGAPLPDIVKERIEKELSIVREQGTASLFMIAQLQVEHSEQQGFHVMTRGSAGASLLSFLAGISEVNPLPPHYCCLHCRYTEFFIHSEVESGFDLPETVCPVCGEKMKRDGQNIPYQAFFGWDGKKTPDFDLNFSGEYIAHGYAIKHIESLFGKKHVVKGGVVSTVPERLAQQYIRNYEKKTCSEFPEKTREALADALTGVKRAVGQHPGGLVIIPESFAAEDFTPLQYAGNDPDSAICTHFDFHDLSETLLKLDDLGHDVPTLYHYLEKYTGISITKADLFDPAVYQLFNSSEPLGISAETFGVQTGTFSLPCFNTPFAQKLLSVCQPHSFTEIIKIIGLLHGTGVWHNNAETLLETGVCRLSDVIASREDIFNAIKAYDLRTDFALRVPEFIWTKKTGKHISKNDEIKMLKCGIPGWYIDSLKKIRYLYPKAYAVETALAAVRLGWYKLYYPAEYYAAYLTTKEAVIEEKSVMCDEQQFRKFIEQKCEREQNTSCIDTVQIFELIYEALTRGIRFLPADRTHSDPCRFLPENGAVRLPTSSIANGVVMETKTNG